MPHYQLYTSHDDGHICFGEELYAHDDGEAIELARIRLEGCDLELWQSGMKVALIPKDAMPILCGQPVFA